MKIDIEKIKSQKSVEELLEFGMINIDKPSGPTSFNVSDFVKKSLGLRKTSHFGTLDPKVTGVLPVALNRACKLTGFFIGENKRYVGIMRLHEDISLNKIREEIKKNFLGEIMQTPPVKSSVKREARKRRIEKFDLLEKKRLDVIFNVECQGGTYIRKLVHDIGESLKIGAHMLELRRTKAGMFPEKVKNQEKNIPGCVTLYKLEKAIERYAEGNPEKLKEMIIPGEIVSELYPAFKIKKESEKRILTGKPIFNEDIECLNEKEIPIGDIASVFCGNRFIGMYKIIGKKDEKEVFAKPEFVYQPLK